jgi:hypothetical protein
MEDPHEKLRKDDQIINITDAVYCRVRNYEVREQCKRKQGEEARQGRHCDL